MNNEINQLKQRIDEIKRENDAKIGELLERINELEAKTQSESAPSEKAVTEKTSDDSNEKEPWTNKINAGYNNGFFVETSDGNYRLNFSILSQFQLSINDTDGQNTTTSFDVRRLRFRFGGNAFREWFTYAIQVEAAGGNANLLDFYVNFAYDIRFSPRAGQYKVPFTREQLTSAASLQLVERSILDQEFSYARDIGVSLYGQLFDSITYGFGAFNGDGINDTNTDSNLLYAGRVQLNMCCGNLRFNSAAFPSGGDYGLVPNFARPNHPIVQVAAATVVYPGLNINRKTPSRALVNRFDDIGIVEGNVYSITADAVYKNDRFNLIGEYDGRWISSNEVNETAFDQGFRVQGGIFAIVDLIEIAARYSYIKYDTNVGSQDSTSQLTPGLNIYFTKNRNWKLQFSYSLLQQAFQDSEDINSNIIRAQLQALF